MKSTHQGSCLCGLIKFEVQGDFDSFFLCHCKHCQKDTGSAHAANLFSKSAQIIWLSSTETIQSYNLPATRHSKSFCTNCGSAVPSEQMAGKLLVVPAGSLDSEVTKKPDAHIFCSSKASWTSGLDQIKRFEKFPV